MPKNKKPAGGRPAKNFEPRFGAKKTGGPSAGSRSPGHRGFRAEPAEAPRKNRWNSEDRDARRAAPAGERPSYGDRAPRGDRNERPAYNRGERSERPSYGDRTERPRYERSERPAYGDRAPRGDRPSYGDRNERPAYNRGERSERPAFNRGGDRPAYGDRTERPRFDRDAPRGERPSYGDRAPRGDRNERPAYNRGERSERPSYGERSERPRFDRDARGGDRPSYGDRAPRGERPSYGDRNDRPARNFGGDRPRYNKDEAPRRSASDFYPAKDEKARFTPEEDVVLERLEAQATTAADVDGVSFADLGLGDNICRQLASMGAASPFAIQAATIPDVLAGKDVLGRGKTGSGKTIAFGSPVVERLMENNGGKDRKQGRAPRALIMAPT
ncbi:MAG: DEAD/DEAH box helicase, partial [Actinomycetales bacterium]|nr:DEAD/DEAH box helicase [Actinomycetales bacterium]